MTISAAQVYVDIYPVDGGALQLRGAQVLALVVEKDIRDPSGGRFTIELPPGGPSGPNAVPSWAEVITPMSLCVIGMRRGPRANITMVGVVESVRLDERWRTGQPTQRAIIVSGCDFQIYLNQATWNVLVVLAGGLAPAIGSALGNPGLGLAAILGGAMLGNVAPNVVAQAWWDKVVGPQGILGKTRLKFKLTSIAVADAMGTLFEPYPTKNVTIPAAATFAGNLGSFWAKLSEMMPAPWYETFTLTAPTGWFPGGAPPTGFSFGIDGLSERANVYLVSRINPVPNLLLSVAGRNFTYDGMDVARWERLPIFAPESGGPIATDMGFDESEARNFYTVDATYLMSSSVGTGQAGNTLPTFFTFGGMLDLASLERYGLREEAASNSWFCNFGAQATNADFSQVIADLNARLASYHHPLPLMAKGTMTFPLRPDIIPGSRFACVPLNKVRIGETWQFYIQAVSHEFVFGGPSTTTLKLTRGLPLSVYSESGAGGLLEAVHVGNAKRIDGGYQFTPGQPPNLQPFNLHDAKAQLSQISNAFYAVAQATGASGAP